MSKFTEAVYRDGSGGVVSGHWVLASLGKKVLRPGGIQLTRIMLRELAIGTQDRVVELAPGLGATARRTLTRRPAAYCAVDKNPDVVQKLNQSFAGTPYRSIQADAAHTGLDPKSATVVYGEAMLTMQSRHAKQRMIKEAGRLLVAGGRYAIHEIMYLDNAMDAAVREADRELSSTVQHAVLPIRESEWRQLLEDAGFVVEKRIIAPMHLLEPARIMRDEGVYGALRFLVKFLSKPAARKRVLAMRRVFRAHESMFRAVLFICRKQPAAKSAQ